MSDSTARPADPLASVAELGAVVPAVAKVVASELEELLESSVLGQTLPVQLVLSLVNGVLVAPVEVHVLPPTAWSSTPATLPYRCRCR